MVPVRAGIRIGVLCAVTLVIACYNPLEHSPQYGFGSYLLLFPVVLTSMGVGTAALTQLLRQLDRPMAIRDVFGGIVGPLVCFRYDPIVFHDTSILAPASGYVAVVASIGLGTLLLHIVHHGRPVWVTAVSAGICLAGAGVAVLLGIVLLPLSIVGLIFLTGVFGCMLFITADVLYRTGMQDYRRSRPQLARAQVVAACIPGVLLASPFPIIVLPIVLQVGAHMRGPW